MKVTMLQVSHSYFIVTIQPPYKPFTLQKTPKPKNFLDRFVGYKDDILRFIHDFEVPFMDSVSGYFSSGTE